MFHYKISVYHKKSSNEQTEEQKGHKTEKAKGKMADVNQPISITTLHVNGLKNLIKGRGCQTG